MARSRLVLLLSISVGASLLLFWADVANYGKRIAWTDFSLRIAREDVRQYRQMTGDCPASLHEMAKFAVENPGCGLHERPFAEYISHRNGNRDEHSTLNGEGGLFYDPNDGKVRVNLLKPLGRYMPLYIGKGRCDVPSDW